MNKAVLALLALIALSFGGWQSPALAQAPGFIQQYNAVCDPKSPTHCASPDSTGALPITGTISASSSVKATAAAPVYVEGSTTNPVSVDLAGNARVVCVTGCAGGTFNNNADAVATSTTNGQSASWLYGYNGATWDRLRSDVNKYLNVDIQTITASLPAGANVIGGVTQSGTWSVRAQDGSGNALTSAARGAERALSVQIVDGAGAQITTFGGGSFNNNSDAVATSATNSGVAAYLYGFNGTTFDRLRADANKYLNVDIQTITASLPAGANVIGHVIADTGSTTAVTGNVTVVQGTGTNLHVVTDATSVTAATLAAETTKVIGTVRVLGNGGATVDSTVGAGTAPANAVIGGALYNSTEIGPTTGQAFALQGDAKGRLRNVIMDGAGNTRAANVNNSSQLSVSVDGLVSLPAGSNVIGHVIADTGSTTAVTGNVTVVQPTASNLNAQVVGTVAHDGVGTSANPLLIGGYASAAAPTDVSNDGDAVRTWHLRNGALAAQVTFGGVLASTGNGITGTGSQRVTIASDNTAFTVNAAQSGTWNINNISGTITLPSLAATSTKQSDGTQKTQIVDGSGNVIGSTSNKLDVNCASGCAGGTFNNNADAVATSATNGQSAAWLYGYNGTTWDRLRVDGSKNLDVNCAVGCSGGTFNNNADAVATSATNGQQAAWLYGYNGTTYDRLRVDGSKNLLVGINSALPAGSNVIGHVIVDTTSTTAVTQATAANLNAAVVGTVTPADGAALGTTSVRDYSLGGTYNGSTVDMARGAANALNSTGTGIPTAQIVGQFDDASPTAITENQFGNLRMSANRNAYTTLRDAAGNERGANVTAGNALTIDQTTIAGTATAVNNGTVSAGVQRVTIASDSTGQVALAAGSATVGGTFGFAKTVSATVTKSTTTTTYTVGDAWSDSTTAPTVGGYTFSNMGRISGGSGIITDVIVTNSVGPALMLQGELWIYDTAVTADNDNAAFTNVDAEVLTVVAVVPFTLAASAVGSVNSYANIQNLNIGYTTVGSADLRFKVKVQNAYVNTASEVLQFRLKIVQTN